MRWFAVSDLHGRPARYKSLMEEIERSEPPAVLMGGDLFPRRSDVGSFLREYLFGPIKDLREKGIKTRFLTILGNDDPREFEYIMIDSDSRGLIDYVSMRSTKVDGIPIVGYPFVTPSPFLLKDWESYDIDRSLRPGCIPLEDGILTTDRRRGERTIHDDMKELSGITDPRETIYMFHCPPFDTHLDITGSGKKVGSRAIRDHILKFDPPVTLHGHIHESSRVSGHFYQKIGNSLSISTCDICDGLNLVLFDPEGKGEPERREIK